MLELCDLAIDISHVYNVYHMLCEQAITLVFLISWSSRKELADNAIVQVRKCPKDTQMVTAEQLAVNRLSSRHNATCTSIILQDIQWLG